MNTLTVSEVTTQIGSEKLIENISLELKSGEIMGLVGHNGAGKSTLMKTIVGMSEKTNGKIMIHDTYDQDDHLIKFKQCLSYLPEEPMLLTELTVMQHFQLYAMSYGLSEGTLTKKVNQYVAGFELTDKLNEYPESLSKGMRQKAQTICALLPNTPVLLIDEPFIGLDIYAMDYLVNVILEKASKGTSILLTTHQMDRVKEIADSYIMLQYGKISQQGSIENFEIIKRGSDK